MVGRYAKFSSGCQSKLLSRLESSLLGVLVLLSKINQSEAELTNLCSLIGGNIDF